MTKFKIFGIGFLLILVVSCQKDELPSSATSNPEFTSSITFNGETYALSAGEMGLVQTSETDTTGGGIAVTGLLSDPDCSNCGPGFKLSVKSPDGYIYTPASDLISDLDQWDYSFEPTGDTTYAFSMHAAAENAGNMGNWVLNGESLNTSPTDSLDFILPAAGSYTLDFTSTSGLCELDASRSLEFDGQSIPCYGNIDKSLNLPNSFSATPGPSFNLAATTYFWSYADTLFTTGNNNDLTINSLGGINQICVDMSDSVGCSVTACISFGTTPVGGSCSANILLSNPELVPAISPSAQAKIGLEFTDNSGTTYFSENGNQTNETITLISAENYTEPTMPDRHFIKVAYQIDCLLFDGSGAGYPFSGTIVTAFETP